MILNNESFISEKFLYLLPYDVATLRCRWNSEHLEKHCACNATNLMYSKSGQTKRGRKARTTLQAVINAMHEGDAGDYSARDVTRLKGQLRTPVFIITARDKFAIMVTVLQRQQLLKPRRNNKKRNKTECAPRLHEPLRNPAWVDARLEEFNWDYNKRLRVHFFFHRPHSRFFNIHHYAQACLWLEKLRRPRELHYLCTPVRLYLTSLNWNPTKKGAAVARLKVIDRFRARAPFLHFRSWYSSYD